MSAGNSAQKRYSLPHEVTEAHLIYFQGEISKGAFLLAVLLSWHRDVAPFSFEQIVKMADDAERPASQSTLRRHLVELVDIKCLIAQEPEESQPTTQTA